MEYLVSVIITSFNAEKFIYQAVKSILNQTYENFECHFVDDGSQDRTVEIIQDVHDPRIRIHQPGRLGRGRALNYGIKQSHGELIAIQDADDVSHPRRLELQVQTMIQQPEISTLGSDQRIISARDASLSNLSDPESRKIQVNCVKRSLIFFNPIPHTSLMVRRTALEKVSGYDESRSNLFDWDLLIRLCEAGHPPYKYLLPLVYKRIHNEQFFEKKRRLYYVKSCLKLQRTAISKLGRNPVLLAPLAGLFLYRLLPHKLRITARRCYGAMVCQNGG